MDADGRRWAQMKGERVHFDPGMSGYVKDMYRSKNIRTIIEQMCYELKAIPDRYAVYSASLL